MSCNSSSKVFDNIKSRVNTYIGDNDLSFVKRVYGDLMEGKIPYPKFLELMFSIDAKVEMDIFYDESDEYDEYDEYDESVEN